jgi:hypothetical protein
VAELESGFGGALANNELVFMILEGPMIMIAVVVLTAFHPGFCLGGLWASIGSSTGKSEKSSAVRSGFPFGWVWATMGRSARKPDEKDTEHKLEKAASTPSAQNSKESVSS